ncbi:hypothetical protein [Halovivax limisalsi]|uniref:hypothetical protein n=1 Tax=Halovivax limisalsi TaxID=1453760 RepID=UPI001FFD5CB8|nr:hypothetical protein [Halovivax limisalsi]
MTDLTAFGVTEPQDPPATDEEPTSRWPECVGCGQRSRDVRERLGQSIALCPDCFRDREGL